MQSKNNKQLSAHQVKKQIGIQVRVEKTLPCPDLAHRLGIIYEMAIKLYEERNSNNE